MSKLSTLYILLFNCFYSSFTHAQTTVTGTFTSFTMSGLNEDKNCTFPTQIGSNCGGMTADGKLIIGGNLCKTPTNYPCPSATTPPSLLDLSSISPGMKQRSCNEVNEKLINSCAVISAARAQKVDNVGSVVSQVLEKMNVTTTDTNYNTLKTKLTTTLTRYRTETCKGTRIKACVTIAPIFNCSRIFPVNQDDLTSNEQTNANVFWRNRLATEVGSTAKACPSAKSSPIPTPSPKAAFSTLVTNAIQACNTKAADRIQHFANFVAPTSSTIKSIFTIPTYYIPPIKDVDQFKKDILDYLMGISCGATQFIPSTSNAYRKIALGYNTVSPRSDEKIIDITVKFKDNTDEIVSGDIELLNEIQRLGFLKPIGNTGFQLTFQVTDINIIASTSTQNNTAYFCTRDYANLNRLRAAKIEKLIRDRFVIPANIKVTHFVGGTNGNGSSGICAYECGPGSTTTKCVEKWNSSIQSPSEIDQYQGVKISLRAPWTGAVSGNVQTEMNNSYNRLNLLTPQYTISYGCNDSDVRGCFDPTDLSPNGNTLR